MTKQMLEDFINSLKRKNKILTICLIIAVALFVGMTIFAFSSFEITYEEKTDYDYSIEQGGNTQGDNSSIDQNIDLSETHDRNDTVYVVCATIILCVLLITTGVIVYVKSKTTRTYTYTQNKKDND